VKIFGRGKKKEEVAKAQKNTVDLKEVCGSDEESYQALVNTLRTGLWKIPHRSLRETIENAKKFEKTGDLRNAWIHWQEAGALAILEGNVKKVIECFSKLQDLFKPGTHYKILDIPERAVAKAQEYYQKCREAKEAEIKQ
jgi:hypothetical protein